MRHPVRLVDLKRHARLLVSEDEALAYRIGLRGAMLMYEHFPAFYAESCMDAMQITLPRLLGCCAAFWQLVESRGLELRWPGDGMGMYDGGLSRNDLGETPADTVVMFDGVSPSWMTELGGFIAGPRPMFFGYGVQALLDQESDNYPNAPLTILLWHLFQYTPLGLGVPIEPMAANIDEDLAIDILRIKPLPKDAPLHSLCARLDLPIARAHGVTPYKLIAYAFGKTENELADHDEYEVEAIYMGEIDEDFDWSEIDQLIKLQCEARELESTYGMWSQQMTNIHDLRRLAGQLHKACRAAERELQEPPKTLITLLSGDPQWEERMADAYEIQDRLEGMAV